MERAAAARRVPDPPVGVMGVQHHFHDVADRPLQKLDQLPEGELLACRRSSSTTGWAECAPLAGVPVGEEPPGAKRAIDLARSAARSPSARPTSSRTARATSSWRSAAEDTASRNCLTLNDPASSAVVPPSAPTTRHSQTPFDDLNPRERCSGTGRIASPHRRASLLTRQGAQSNGEGSAPSLRSVARL